MKSLVACLMGLMIFIQTDATQQPTISGHVRLAGGLPVAGAQVMLFDVADLRQGMVARATTDEAGQFALPLAALGRLALPEGFALGANYPNPFNPATIIPYELATTSPVKLEVFNTLGQRMATLVDGNQEAGSYQAQWDGTDAAGQAAAAGLYFYRLTVDGVPQTGRMVLVDGQAGVPMSGAGVEELPAAAFLSATYGLVVSGPGMVAYVDADFGVEAGMGPVDITVEARRDAPLVEPTQRGILGDVDNNGQVDIADGLLVAAYSVNAATALPNNGDIARGDVNGDNQMDLTDAWLLATYEGDLAALERSGFGRGKAVGTLSGDVLFSDDFSSGNLSKWTTRGGGSGSLEVEDGALKLVGTAGGNYTVGVSKEIFPTKTYSNYVMSFDWKSTVKETPYGVSIVRALFYNSADERIGELLALNTGWPNRPFEDHGGPPGRYGGVFKEHESFGWERVTINTSTSTPLINTSDVHKIKLEALVYNDAGSGGDLYVDNFSFVGSSDDGAGGAPAGAKIYWAGGLDPRGKIYRANLDGTNVEDLVTSTLSTPCDIALDVADGKIYWTDMASWNEGGPRGAIRRVNLDGSNVENLITNGLGYPCGLALDVADGKMYWTDFDTDKIRRANLDGSNIEDLVTSGLRDTDGIALDVASGKMYWIDRGTKKIQRANLDGSNIEDLVTSGFEYPVSIALDAVGRKMYWTEAGLSGSSKIRRANFDGSNIEDLVTFGWQSLGGLALDVAGGKMYWGNGGNQDIAGIVRRANLDGSNVQTVILRDVIPSSRVNAPRSIALDVSGQTPPPNTGGEPDLVVRNVRVDDSTPSVGDEIRMDVDVYNQGSASASWSRLHYYWSNDATYSSSDTYIDDDRVSSLASGETDAEDKRGISVSFSGTRYLIACADANNDVSESNENNNCTAVQVTVQAAGAPDLVISSASVDDSTPSAGDRIRMDVTVRNQGSAASTRRTIAFFRSADRYFDNSDARVGGLESVSSMGSGETRSTESDRFSVSSSGTHYYIVCLSDADEESNNDNNCSEGSQAVQVTVQAAGAPDLVISSASVDDSTPSVGDRIRMDVTVRNQGSAASTRRTIAFFRSADRYFDNSDARVGGLESVSSMGSGETRSTESDRFSVPASGTHYYIVCLSDADEESNNDNNCSEGSQAVQVTVQAAGAPDLVISSASVDDSTPSAGDEIRMDVTVRNQGSAASTRRTIAFFRSADRYFDNSDARVGGLESVSSMGPGETRSTESDRFSVPASGTHYYIVCLSDAGEESNNDNNCSEGSQAVQVIVGAAGAPDLVVINARVDNSSPSVGSTIRMDVDVYNQGSAAASWSRLHYYWSNDATYSSSDTYIDDDRVSSLASGETDAEDKRGISVSFSGTRYLIACADANNDVSESNENNNCTAVQVTVQAAGAPDLVISSASVDDSTPSVGDRIRMDVTVRNQGSAASTRRTIAFFRSADRYFDNSDERVGGLESVSSMGSGETRSTESDRFSVPSGTHYYIVCLSDADEESNNDNNCSEGSQAVQVTVQAEGAPDLVVFNARGELNNTGSRVRMYVDVYNQGSASASASRLNYYRSNDATYSSNDTYLDYDNVPSLASGETEAENEWLDVPSSSGTYYYIACADAEYNVSESNENNNCAAMQVTTGAADLVVFSASVDDSTPSVGDEIRMDVTVYNRGSASASSSRLHYYRSNDATYSSNDTYLNYDSVPGLASGETEAENEWLDVPSSSGTYYYIACADANNNVSESDENNNCTAVQVTVQAAGAPDLVVENVRGDLNDDGSRVKMYVDVYNQGSASASSSRLYYYRSNDATYSSSDTYLDSDRVPSLASGETGNENEWLDVPSTAGTYYYIACADANNDVSESNENNNCTEGSDALKVITNPNPDVNIGDLTTPYVYDSSNDSVHRDSNDKDYYRFTLTQQRTMLLELRNLSGDADLFLEDENKNILASSRSGGTSNEQIYHSLDAGTYYIRVDADASGTINYRLRYRSEYVYIDNFGDLTNLTLTVTTPTGSVNKSNNDRDYFAFTLSSTRTVRIELINLSADADLVIENADRNVIASSSKTGTNAELIEKSLGSGYYRIGVKAYDSGTISYQLRYSVP